MGPPERSDHQSCLTHGARSLGSETSHLVVVPKMMKLQKNMGRICNSFYNILDTFPIVHAISIEQVSGIKRFSQIIWVNLRLRLFAMKILKKSHCISISSAKSRWFRHFYECETYVIICSKSQVLMREISFWSQLRSFVMNPSLRTIWVQLKFVLDTPNKICSNANAKNLHLLTMYI